MSTMPGINLEKIYLLDSYYHVYSRGTNQDTIFRDDGDYAVFLNLFKRYLSDSPVQDQQGREYLWLHDQIELLAYCLMPNHFHALVYQTEPGAITRLFKSTLTAYGMYFNRKYMRHGPLFQSRFRASIITSDVYLQHISRYIHLNPKNYRRWPFSSLPYYQARQHAAWVSPDRILELFASSEEYMDFLADYEDHKKMLKKIRSELADV